MCLVAVMPAPTKKYRSRKTPRLDRGVLYSRRRRGRRGWLGFRFACRLGFGFGFRLGGRFGLGASFRLSRRIALVGQIALLVAVFLEIGLVPTRAGQTKAGRGQLPAHLFSGAFG